MGQKILIYCALLLVLLSGTAGAWGDFFADAEKIEERERELVPGVVQISLQVYSEQGNQSIQIIRAQQGQQEIHLRSAFGQEKLTAGLATVRSQAQKVDKPGERVVAAVNADFFQTDRSATTYGVPLGLHVEQGELVASLMDYPAIVFQEGRAYLENPRMVTRATCGETGTRFDIDSINRRVSWGQLAVFTPTFGERTPALEGAREMVLTGLERPFQFNTYHLLEATGEIQAGGGTPLEEGTVVLSATGAGIDFIESLQPGGEVRLVAAFLPPYQTITDALAGSHYLLQGGEKMELDSRPLVTGRHPRTAVGTGSGEILLITVDGRRSEAAGMSLHELADFFQFLGAEEAINLDGGGSTTMLAANPLTGSLELANRPSDGVERAVSNSLLITYRSEEDPFPGPEQESTLSRDQFSTQVVNARASLAVVDAPGDVAGEALRLDYELEAPPGETGAAYLNLTPPLILDDSTSGLGVWVYGDGSGHWLRAQALDSMERTYFLDAAEGGRVNWRGWNYVQFPIPEELEGSARIIRLYLAEFREEQMGPGTIYFGPLQPINNQGD